MSLEFPTRLGKSNGSEEFDESVAIGLFEVIESFGRAVGITLLAVGMPHDGFDFVACAAVVHSVFCSGILDG